MGKCLLFGRLVVCVRWFSFAVREYLNEKSQCHRRIYVPRKNFIRAVDSSIKGRRFDLVLSNSDALTSKLWGKISSEKKYTELHHTILGQMNVMNSVQFIKSGGQLSPRTPKKIKDSRCFKSCMTS